MFKPRKRLESTSENYQMIFMPMVIGLSIAGIAILVGTVTQNVNIANFIFGFSALIIATSGYWQIKMRVVPGYPTLRGGCAVVFGSFFLIFTVILGIGLIISTILGL